MFGAVQLGIMAACVVLFVPMGMAGWHLSRNKMLFFSGALFITLAVGVHLIPYFPSVSTFMYPVPVSVSSSSVEHLEEDRNSCISLLHEITYDVDLNSMYGEETVLNDESSYGRKWNWENSGPVAECDFQKLSRSDASDLLNGSWVVIAGDSQSRLFAVSLLNLVLGSEEMESIRGDLFKRHSDYQLVVDEIGMKLDFFWAPYAMNLTDRMRDLKQNRTYPDLLVMGTGLWHMLYFTNSSDYGILLDLLKRSLVSFLPVSPEFSSDGPISGSVSIRSPHLFWLEMPMLINTMLNTEEKREKMTDAMCNAYDKELFRSGLLRENGGPLMLLDIKSLSQKCGARCSMDGMHYNEVVYEASVHIMLNALLIESHQKL